MKGRGSFHRYTPPSSRVTLAHHRRYKGVFAANTVQDQSRVTMIGHFDFELLVAPDKQPLRIQDDLLKYGLNIQAREWV